MAKHKETSKQATKRLRNEEKASSSSSLEGVSQASKKRKTENAQPSQSTPQQKVIPSCEEGILERIMKLRQQTASSISTFKFNKKRVRVLSDVTDMPDSCQGILYWMSRDQRVQDNWGLLYAQRLALKLEVPLHVCFCLLPKFLDATIRHYDFMMRGLEEVEQELRLLDIPFHLLRGEPKDALPSFMKEHMIGGLVTDFSPLRVPLKWLTEVEQSVLNIPVCQVDAHNIVPCWEASPKLEYGARTIRPKITKQLSTFLTEFPPLVEHPFKTKMMPEPVDWPAAEESLEVDRTVGPVAWAKPGSTAGLRMLEEFCVKRLKYFEADRNNPNKSALSNLSPWLHFGQISAQRAALIVRGYRSKYGKSVEAFIEESVIRRELSDNFCFYNEHYDTIEGTNAWAKETLKTHAKDKREYVYSKEQLEKARTHDDLWNAAQVQLVKEAKMHGFLRMYWAKKILEWTKSPEEALHIAIYLNDKYSLDGRDPNGYVGCMWSICGIHDQGWAERPVFGKIRFMNYNGCKRKFDVSQFVQKYKQKL